MNNLQNEFEAWLSRHSRMTNTVRLGDSYASMEAAKLWTTWQAAAGAAIGRAEAQGEPSAGLSDSAIWGIWNESNVRGNFDAARDFARAVIAAHEAKQRGTK